MIKINLQFDHPDYSNEALNSSISDILNHNILLAMATVRGTESYVNTAYYCFDRSLQFYILTEPTTQHSQNLAKNSSVALAIYDSTQPWDGDKRGMQVFGECHLATGKEVVAATTLYIARFPGLKQWIRKPVDFVKGVINSRFYIIRTESLKLFDEVSFGKETYITLIVKR